MSLNNILRKIRLEKIIINCEKSSLKLNQTKLDFEKVEFEFNKLKNIYNTNNNANNLRKGSQCSVSGKKYELQVFDVVKNCRIQGSRRKFNSQKRNELGGCSSKNDLECNYLGRRDVPIEIKKSNTPDWMQSTLVFDKNDRCWKCTEKSKIPSESRDIIHQIMKDKIREKNIIFNGKIPSFIDHKITHQQWLEIKKNTEDFNDQYFECPNNTISELYAKKGCYYIQISNKGLYHLGTDICGFNVPYFECEQQIRIRIKVHTRLNKNGFCNLSVTLACQPKNIKNLKKSPFSLDNKENLPKNLKYLL